MSKGMIVPDYDQPMENNWIYVIITYSTLISVFPWE